MGDLTRNLSWHEVLRYSGAATKEEMEPGMVKVVMEEYLLQELLILTLVILLVTK